MADGDNSTPSLFDAELLNTVTAEAAPAQAATDGQPIAQAATDGATAQVESAVQALTPAPSTTPAPVAPAYPSRVEQNLDAIRRALETPKTAATPPTETYTAEQLSNHKVTMLREMAKAQAVGDDLNADKYARTVAWCDDQLMNQRLSSEKTTWGRTTATQQLNQEASKLLAPYQAELTPGTPLFNQANGVYTALLQSGYPDGPVTASMAALMAIQSSGRGAPNSVQAARSAVVSDIQKGLKAAVVAGAGGANPRASGPVTAADIWSQSEKEFAAYEKQMRGR